MAGANSASSPSVPLADNFLPSCCFLLKCIHRGQMLPSQFESLLEEHHCNTIVFRHGLQQWPVTVTDHSFGEGWDDFCQQNIIKRHDTLLLRHSGNLIFDIIHFCELQKQVYLRWTVPLPKHLQQSPVHSQSDNHPLVRQQHVVSSLSPDFCQTLTDSICFYQIFSSATPSTLQRIPRFVNYYINSDKTPTLLIKTGHKTSLIGMKRKHLHQNWRNFVLDHQLQHNETLVFIPESDASFTVLIFDDTGVEKILPRYHTFSIYTES